jgi:hypothetical protein
MGFLLDQNIVLRVGDGLRHRVYHEMPGIRSIYP